MTLCILAILLAAATMYIVTLLNQISRMGNKHGHCITGLEQELHEALEAVGHYHSPGEDIVMPSVSYDPGEGDEHASCIVIADPSEHSGRIILDDTYDVNIVHDKELDDRLRSSIARRMGEDTPIVQIFSKVHEEDVILDGELDLSYLLPTHIRGTHPYSFRTGEWARITGIEIINLQSGPRHVFKAVYDDDAKDTVAICDSANYETK